MEECRFFKVEGRKEIGELVGLCWGLEVVFILVRVLDFEVVICSFYEV